MSSSKCYKEPRQFRGRARSCLPRALTIMNSANLSLLTRLTRARVVWKGRMLSQSPDKDAQELPLGVRLKIQLRGEQKRGRPSVPEMSDTGVARYYQPSLQGNLVANTNSILAFNIHPDCLVQHTQVKLSDTGAYQSLGDSPAPSAPCVGNEQK